MQRFKVKPFFVMERIKTYRSKSERLCVVNRIRTFRSIVQRSYPSASVAMKDAKIKAARANARGILSKPEGIARREKERIRKKPLKLTPMAS
ncbi:hypothetical protein ZIOFF_067615 [Zingiber officinale]|uniref:Uncharacterized protein n=1 Tax=Zingiber officinale TaxID=94328 RepID=A0A8J5BK98_ZINOF|nr:hypothetical protein ZIOFF_067615 [Zingiber officinale]